MSTVLWLLIALPAGAGAILVGGGHRLDRVAGAAAVTVAGAVVALAIGAGLARPAVSVPFVADAPLGMAVDGLAALVAVTVAVVSLLVLLFAAGVPGGARARFFGLMLLFVAAVELTVTATTLPGLLLAWEVMGATSYALIAHHWTDPDAVAAGSTAFLVTRTGDLGLYLAAGAALAAGSDLGLERLAQLPGPWVDVAAAGVLAAALGKAAQLPFSFWLSRAMAGPAPVSALLHSAAMVAMGGYLLLRLHPLLLASGWAAPVAAWAGAATTVVLGAVALAQHDLKQVLAASTSAQLGFVLLAAGSTAPAAVGAGLSQLVAHAATKSLLFLVAGVWLTAFGTGRLGLLQGVARRDRLVGVLFTIGALALAGVPPLSLWATKDATLSVAGEHSNALYAVGLAGAALSALYAARMLALVWRDTTGPGTAKWSASAAQWLPLLPLAAGAGGLSVLTLPAVSDAVAGLLGETGGPHGAWWEPLLGGLVAIAATAVAVAYADRMPSPALLGRWLGAEAAAHRLVVRPTLRLSRVLAVFDDRVLDRATEASATGARRLAQALGAVDDYRVDRFVAAVAAGARRLGGWARLPQTGQLHQYYAQVVVALTAALLLLLVVR